ncbi:MATE family efflux transporter [Rubritalea marina]|uniref:MATE family efflux transporter n=1 Tax=Rubritalea marina TaxID=361055 RepID=UPI000373B7EF|nr:MATE family efflux transporter [Rubritalea marina]
MNIRELKSITALAIPLVIGQLGQMLLGVADTIMVGKLTVLDLASLSFASSLFIIPFVFSIGILAAVSMRTAKARGQNDPATAKRNCHNGLVLSSIVGSALFLIALALYPFLHFLGQPSDVVDHSSGYYLIVMASLIPCAMSIALKNHADALDRPWPAFWIFMAGVALNITLNAGFIFGKWGFPELGLSGAAVATFLARWAIVIAMLLWFRFDSKLVNWTPQQWWTRPDISTLKSLSSLGMPVGLQTLAEVSTFAAAGLLIGHFGAIPLAAHQVTLQASGMAFMLPLGLSMALTVRMGEVHGDPTRHRDIIKSGWFLTLLCSCSTAALFITAGHQVASWFVESSDIIQLAASLLIVSGVFQIVDGLQASSMGMLRGLHDTKTPAKLAIISYWVIGIPSGFIMANYTPLGPQGIWWGLALGLAVASTLLSRRLWTSNKL